MEAFSLSERKQMFSSVERIRRARLMLQQMTQEQKLDLLVKAGLLTQEQADRAKEKLKPDD